MECEITEAVGEGLEDVPTAGDKCEHGVRIAKGDAVAQYCTGCNPASGRIYFAGRRPRIEGIITERVIDTVEYYEQPLSERMAESERMEAL